MSYLRRTFRLYAKTTTPEDTSTSSTSAKGKPTTLIEMVFL